MNIALFGYRAMKVSTTMEAVLSTFQLLKMEISKARLLVLLLASAQSLLAEVWRHISFLYLFLSEADRVYINWNKCAEKESNAYFE